MSHPSRQSAKRKSDSSTLERRPGKLQPKIRLLIVGEGQKTEPNYFRRLTAEPDVQKNYTVTVKKGHGISQDAVVKEAIKYKGDSEYDDVWCVVDVEGPSKADNLRAAIALAGKHKITLWLSNPSIEVWFLLHLAKQARSYLDGDAAEAELKKHWRTHFNREYTKGDEAIYDRLRGYMNTAVANARWVLKNHHQGGLCKDCNSSTELYRLIFHLLPDGITVGEKKHLQVGNIAPDVRLQHQDGRSVQLSSMRGRAVALCFYPSIEQRTSTTQILGLRDARDQFDQANITILGISPDSVSTLKTLAEEHTIPMRLLADISYVAAKDYGVYAENDSENPHLEQSTFVIGPDGVILYVFREFDVQTHATDILAALRQNQD